eukprot:XP_011682036.1 PREDICTED: uncharacterized protein LOC105446660 [Strongylocentrotus purpuratus]
MSVTGLHDEITIIDIDEFPFTIHGFAGGIINLMDTRPNVSFYSLLYFQSSPDDVLFESLIYILSPPERQVQLTFIDIDTTLSEEIAVYDHPSSQSVEYRVAYIYGPLQTGVAVFSTQGGLTVVYDDSSSSMNRPGFHAVARILDIIPSAQSGFCGGTIALDQSTPMLSFSSPLYDMPSIADVHVDCRMHITCPEGKQVRLNFLNIQTTSSQSISVYDHPASLTTSIAFFLGTLTAPSSVYSSAGGLTITYDDDNSASNGRGFLAEARILDGLPMNETGFFGGTMRLTEDSPTITFSTPLYNDPSILYSDINMDCIMHFVGPTGNHIQLILHNFATTSSEEVVVYDHPSTALVANEVSRLKGPLNARVVFFSSGEGLSLLYIDGNFSSSFEPGFCGGAIQLTESLPQINFTTPLYKKSSTGDVEVYCTIYITSESGKQVRLVVHDFENPLLSNQNGFCGGTADLTVSTTSISFSSPLYYNPSTNGLHADCSFHFTSPPEKQIMLMFLDIETTTNERISVYDHPTSTIFSARIAYLYGSVRTPTTIYSSHEGLTVIFEDRSDAYNGPGFSAEARILELPSYQAGFCGGVMALTYSTPRVAFSTPIYDIPLVADVTTICRRYIIAPSRQQIRLTLRDIETTSSKQVIIYDHPTSTSSRYQVFHFYGILNGSAVIISTQGGLNIVMNDVSSLYNGKGFSAEARIYNFDEISSTEFGFCGGAIELSEASQFVTLSSPFFGNPSAVTDAFMDCIMHIKNSFSDNVPGLCGGIMHITETNPSVKFATPLYGTPITSDVSVYCRLTITCPPDKHIELTLFDINIAVSGQLYIYDVPQSGSSATVFTCYGVLNATTTILSSESRLILEYNDVIDVPPKSRGFTANARITDRNTSSIDGLCGGTVSLTESFPSTTFTSPLYGHPSQFGLRLQCTMHIIATLGSQVQLTFFDFETTVDVGISIYDHPSSSDYQIAYLSGKLDARTTVFSSRGGLTLTYQDDSDLSNGHGYLYEARLFDRNTSSIDGLCGGTVSLTESFPSTTFTSPLYGHPSQFGLRLQCTMHIIATLGSQVQLTFFDFETTVDVGISIYDHPSSSDYQIAYLSGKLDARTTVFSSRGGLTLTYRDDSNLSNGHGYLYEARLLDRNTSSIDGLCGGTVSLTESFPSTTFTSPLYGHPSQFGLRLQCTMHITATLGSQVQLTFFDFETTVDVGISIYDHPSSSDYQIAYLSGKLDARTTVFSSRGGLTLTYRDYNEISSTEFGFCGGAIELSEAYQFVTLSSPFFGNPSAATDAFMYCTMHIKSSFGLQTKLTFLDMNTTVNEQVRVYDHPSSTTTTYLVGSFQGDLQEGDAVIVSSRWDSFSDNVPGLCGGFIYITETNPSIQFSTPLYGTSTTTDAFLYCRFTITCPPDKQIKLALFDRNIAVSGQLDIYDGPQSGSSTNVFHVSGILNATTTIISSESTLILDYNDVVNAPAKGRGFTANAQITDRKLSSCGAFSLTHSFPSTNFTSPLYGLPAVLGLRVLCTIHITSSSQVQLTFIDFETAVGESISIYDHLSSSSNQIAYLSGKLDARATVFSSRRGLTLTYRDDSDLFNGRGYLYEARKLDTQHMALDRTCGGYIALSDSFPRVIVTSPLYATPPVSNITMNCWWYFSNPSRNKQIEVVLKNVDIAEDERIDVYNHPSTLSPSLRVASLTGPSGDLLVRSSRYYGLSIALQDLTQGANGRGFVIDARLQGTIVPTISPASSVNMETEAETFPTGQTESTREAGAMTQTNSVTTTTETTSGPPTLPQEQPDIRPMDNTTVITASVVGGLLIIVAGIVTVIVIWSRRKTTTGTIQQEPRPLPLIHTYASPGTSQRTYERSIRPAGDHDTTEQVEGHVYAIPNNVGGSGDSDAPEHGRDNNGEGNIEVE